MKDDGVRERERERKRRKERKKTDLVVFCWLLAIRGNPVDLLAVLLKLT